MTWQFIRRTLLVSWDNRTNGQAIPHSCFWLLLTVEAETKDVIAIGAAAVLGAGAVAAGIQAKKKRDSAAVVDLYNTIVELPEPSNLTEQAVNSVGSKYGISLQKDEADGLQRIYGQYLESLIPTGEIQLRCGTCLPRLSGCVEGLGFPSLLLQRMVLCLRHINSAWIDPYEAMQLPNCVSLCTWGMHAKVDMQEVYLLSVSRCSEASFRPRCPF